MELFRVSMYPVRLANLMVIGALLHLAAACSPATPVPGVGEIAETAIAGTSEVLASPLDPNGGSSAFLSYEDLDAGFRIDHPSDWSVAQSPGSEVAIEFPATIGEPLGIRAGVYMVGFRLEEIGLSTLDEIFDSFGASLSEQVLVDPPADIELAGIHGYQASFLDLEIEGGGRLLTFIDGEQGYVIITLVQPAVHYETFQPVFDAMLNSLEFTPPG